jgi:hypothetical protein
MEIAGYVILAIAAIGWLVIMITRMVEVFPEGVVGLIAILGLGILLIKALRDRLQNKEDDHYSKTVDK